MVEHDLALAPGSWNEMQELHPPSLAKNDRIVIEVRLATISSIGQSLLNQSF